MLKRISLPVQILIAILLAVAVGLFFGDLVAWLGPIGDAYVMLLKMSILPYIVVALIHGLGSLRASEAWRLVKLGGIFMIIIWVVVIASLFAFSWVFPTRAPAYYYAQRAVGAADLQQYVNLFIPGNPFFSLANNIVPAVVVFCLFFGSALMFVRRELKEPFLHWLEVAIHVLSRITGWVIRLAPIGVFALVGHTIGTISIGQLEKLGIYLIAFLAAALFFAFWALPALVASLTRIRYVDFTRMLQSGVLLAFATGNIFVALPAIMVGMESLSKKYGFYTEESRRISKTLVPIAYNLPLVGNLMAMFFILFLGFFYAIDFTIPEKIHLIAASIFTLAGPVTAGLNSIAFLVEALRLPQDGVALFAETFSVTRNLQALGGATGIATFSLLALCAYTHNLRIRVFRLAISMVVGLVLLSGAILLIRWLEPKPHWTRPIYMELSIDSDVPATIYRSGDPILAPPTRKEGENSLDHIRRTKRLRVGYNASTMPFAYFNDKDELVGYDIALAYKMAGNFDWELEFMPFAYETLAEDLAANRFDIAMSAVSVNNERLTEMAFTSPSSLVEVVFIVPDAERLEYADLTKVQERRDLTFGVLKGSAIFSIAEKTFPNARIVPLDSYDEYLKDSKLDGVLWTDKEGLAWVLIHQKYSIVEPMPRIHQGYYAFALPLNSVELLDQVNYWIQLKRLDGSLDEMQTHWIEGKPDTKPQRWSVIRNVLGWVD